jgi:sortase A
MASDTIGPRWVLSPAPQEPHVVAGAARRSRSLFGVLHRILGAAGRSLLALGVLILLFTAYQLWGTGILESHSQTTLRSQLTRELPRGAAAKAEQRTSGHATPPGPDDPSPQLAPPVAAPAAGKPIGVIQIPSIGLDQVVVEGVQAAQLRTGPGHYPGTPLPGEAGNVAIAGHRTTYAHPFYDLNSVTPGDKIVITTPQGVFVYAAGDSSVVPPSDVSVIGPTSGAQLTLTTCNPRYSATTRLVLHATLVRSLLFPARGEHRATAPSSASSRSSQAAGAGLAGTGAGGDWLPAVLWGVAAAAGVVGVRVAARHVRFRWAVYLVGAVAVLAVLFVFFAAVSPLLPASL